MRWIVRLGLAIGLLLLVYTAWPVIDLFRLARAIEQSDLQAIDRHVEFRAVRASVTRQALGAYLALTGHELRLPAPLRETIIGAGAAAAQPALAAATDPAQLLRFLAENWPPGAAGAAATTDGRVALIPQGWAAVGRLYADSEYRLNDFYVSVPPYAPPQASLRLRLRLIRWVWKLYEVELPEEMRRDLARQMIRAQQRP